MITERDGVSMKFGACCDVDKLPLLQKYGYDYIELNFSNIALAGEAEFEKVCEKIRHSGLPAESFNCFFPGSVSLNANVDYDWIKEYAEKGFARAKRLGGKIAVLGSGGSRRVPEGYDRALAAEQFVRVLHICGDIAAQHGMEIAIEPLRTAETNFINTVAEGIEMCKRADHPNVKCLVDFFHLFMNHETLDAVENSGGLIIHTHIARPNEDRRIPTTQDRETCAQWASALKSIAYDGRMSLEGDFYPDFETAIREARPVLELFRADTYLCEVNL